MNDLEKRGYTPASELAKTGTAAVGYLAGGGLLLLTEILGRVRPLGIGLGIAAAVLGLSALRSRDPADRKPGILLTAAGALELVYQFGIPALKPVAGSLLALGALGFLAVGIVKGIRFLKGLRARG